jgi:hypothetical protein
MTRLLEHVLVLKFEDRFPAHLGEAFWGKRSFDWLRHGEPPLTQRARCFDWRPSAIPCRPELRAGHRLRGLPRFAKITP